MKKLLLILLIVPAICHAQTGRIRQSPSAIVRYSVLPNYTYDIMVQNADTARSDMEIVFNDSVFFVNLANWERYQWRGYYPNGFTLKVRNYTRWLTSDWLECGSARAVDKVKSSYKKSVIIKTFCNGKVYPNYFHNRLQ